MDEENSRPADAGRAKRKAIFIRNLTGWTGETRLYRCEPPIRHDKIDVEYVAVSATMTFTGPETYLFPCTANGKVLDWGEMEGSERGSLDHEAALHRAGIEVIE